MIARFAIVAGIALAAIAWPSRADAHRLDEYLQATRVSIGVDRIGLEIDLSPGVDVAERVIASIDADGDGRIADREADAYARDVLRDLSLSLDGRSLAPQLEDRAFPSLEDIRQGIGTIRLAAAVRIPGAAGHRRVSYANAFEPGMSAYLVNALVPSDHRVRLGEQQRDRLQRTYTVDYDVAGTCAWLGWSAAAIGIIGMLVGARRSKLRVSRHGYDAGRIARCAPGSDAQLVR